MTIGERIKKRREELNISQQELAIKAGYKSRSSINKIEKDGRGLKSKKLQEIANILHTTPAYLMGWEEEKKELSSKEKHLLQIYNQLNNQDKQEVINYATYKLSRYTEQVYDMVGYQWGEKKVSEKEVDELLKGAKHLTSDEDLKNRKKK